MFEALIRSSLRHRVLVLGIALFLMVLGIIEYFQRPVDIFPDLAQPTVTVLAEASGFAPEEIETLIVLPLEAALGGVPGLNTIRSTSGDGLAIIQVDFDWNSDLYRDRQLVQERLQLAALPHGVIPEIAPISSITGEIMDLGLYSTDKNVSQLELYTTAEWLVRRRLLSVPGVSQVVIIGEGKKQFQVFPNPDLLVRHEVSIGELAESLEKASLNTSGGYLNRGNREVLVRNLGRVNSVEELEQIVVAGERSRPVTVNDVADVVEGPAFARGSASIDENSGIVLLVFKQPSANTLELSEKLDLEVDRLQTTMPSGMLLRSDIFRQATFLEHAVNNVLEALLIGSLLVLLVVIWFLKDWKASVTTLVAIPISLAVTALFFRMMDMSLNTMTLGGLAIAIGELVDDAIVGVENIVRRLKNTQQSLDETIVQAAVEVRGPIFSGTLIVGLVFLPLFALSGIEGRLFRPLAIAYIVSLFVSMIVSLTVTPSLSRFLFSIDQKKADLLLIRQLSNKVGWIVGKAISWHWTVIVSTIAVFGFGVFLATTPGSEFLPDFDEGTGLVLAFLPTATSLEESTKIAKTMEKALKDLPGLTVMTRYTGRGEHDEHAPPPSISHILLGLDGSLSRKDTLLEIRKRLSEINGISVSVGQPLAHRIDHLLSGVQARIAIKVFGPDLNQNQKTAEEIAKIVNKVSGVTDLYVEKDFAPQIEIKADHLRLSELGLSPGDLARELEFAIGGKVVGQIFQEERTFDIFLRLQENSRDSVEKLNKLLIGLPSGSYARLSELGQIQQNIGQNKILHDNLMRRTAVTCNVQGRSAGEVVEDLKSELSSLERNLPSGMFLRYEGQFASQSKATKQIMLLSILSLLGAIVILQAQLRSFVLTLQVLVVVPAAFTGGILMLVVFGQPFSLPAMVGFISLAGIVIRNGILLIERYQNQIGEMSNSIIQGSQDRAAPVVMTALTTAVGLLPLIFAGNSAGRELLYPLALVVVGGLASSTIFEFTLRPALFWALAKRKFSENG